jgi:hypothetical protein
MDTNNFFIIILLRSENSNLQDTEKKILLNIENKNPENSIYQHL